MEQWVKVKHNSEQLCLLRYKTQTTLAYILWRNVWNTQPNLCKMTNVKSQSSVLGVSVTFLFKTSAFESERFIWQVGSESGM